MSLAVFYITFIAYRDFRNMWKLASFKISESCQREIKVSGGKKRKYSDKLKYCAYFMSSFEHSLKQILVISSHTFLNIGIIVTQTLFLVHIKCFSEKTSFHTS